MLKEALDNGSDVLPEERAERLAKRLRVFTAAAKFLADKGYITVGQAVGLPQREPFTGAPYG
ncbi:hypothetical protein SAMN04488120_101324 [Fontimonas thermophila]|uniref:Uncharacterized protein n=1 Tax=Fontimonas thermophila TaxID=1076937 RepID=A0A1I2HCV2_9GAMM|nr:hypothetical protein SAMN04488120_101324 [Fontimonas thermophila]